MMTVRAEDAAPTTDEEKSFAAKRAAIADWERAYFHEQETPSADAWRRDGRQPGRSGGLDT